MSENRRILAVDDDSAIITIYRQLFSGAHAEDQGYTNYDTELDDLNRLQQGNDNLFSRMQQPEQRKPYQLTVCNQGKDAVEAVQQASIDGNPFAVALIDIRMPPGIDGMETARRIRRYDPNIHLIFVSAFNDHSVDVISAEMGDRALFYQKPFRPDELYQTVRSSCWSWNQSAQLSHLRDNLELQVDLQTRRLTERVRTTDLLHHNAVTREQHLHQLTHRNRFLQAYQDLRLKLSESPLPMPRSQEEVDALHARFGDTCVVSLLLVDDSPLIRESYRAQLESIGFHVWVADSVASGMEQALEEPPDLALIDYNMPNETGDKLILRMMNNEKTENVLPILFTNSGDEMSAVIAGAVYWLQKDKGLKVALQKMGLIRDYLLDQHVRMQQGESAVESLLASADETDNRRVLLVDDEPEVLETLRTVLEPFDSGDFVGEDMPRLMEDKGGVAHRFDVDTASQGQQAVDAVLEAQLSGSPYALAVIDVRMPPGITGIEAARQIRQLSPDIEIVILTAYSDFSLEQIREVLGEDFSFMTKPFRPDDVYQRVLEGCSKWSARHRINASHMALLGLAEEMQEEIERRQQVEKELEQASQAKDEFLSSMSHELRTPLTTILGYNEIILNNPVLPAPIREMLESSTLAGKTLLQLVNDILDMSKIRSGKFELSMAPFDLFKLLDDMVRLMQVYADDRGVGVRMKVAAAAKPFLESQWIGDDMRISQILFNLLSNAIKFSSGKGEVLLRLGLAASTDKREEAEYFKLQVKDQGIGMGEETLRRLFTPYEQADHSTSRQYGGTGLGLFIAQRLARMMGGEITVESEQGVGSIFSLELPLKRSELAVERLSDQSGQRSGQDKQRYRGRLLLAEDTLQLQKLEVMLLEGYGLKVDVANNGLEAVEKGRSGEYQLILMDMQMPEIGGVEATQTLRQQGCTTPIVALSANVMKQDQEQFNLAGGNDFLVKPIQSRHLQRVLNRYFEKDSGCGKAAEATRVVKQSDGGGQSIQISDCMWKEYLSYLSEVLPQLKQAYLQQEWQEVVGFAHALKGLAATYGETEIAAGSDALQQSAKAGNMEQLGNDFHLLVELLEARVSD